MPKKLTYEELEQMVKELEKEALEHERVEEALQESEEFSASLLTNSPNPILVINPDTSLRYVNPSLENLTGFSSSELIGRKAPYPWWTEETLEKTSTDLEEAMLKGAQRLEELFQKKSGERFWVEITSSPVHKNGEFKYYLANWMEITERKRAEEQIKASLKEKEVLLREIHHRVKNNFQVISSLLDMIKMRTQNQEAIDLLTDARAKIYAMALVHTQLYEQKRFDQINMASHIRKLVDYLSEVYSGEGITIHQVIKPTDVYLTLNQAIPCALVLNEVISNGFKHAFKDRQKGMIEIFMQRSADNTIYLKVQDDGIGIPEEIDIYDLNTLGLKLVRNLVQEQLMGKVQVEGNQGTNVSIEFKA